MATLRALRGRAAADEASLTIWRLRRLTPGASRLPAGATVAQPRAQIARRQEALVLRPGARKARQSDGARAWLRESRKSRGLWHPLPEADGGDTRGTDGVPRCARAWVRGARGDGSAPSHTSPSLRTSRHNPGFQAPLIGVHQGDAIGLKRTVRESKRGIADQMHGNSVFALPLTLERPDGGEHRAHFLEAPLKIQAHCFLPAADLSLASCSHRDV